MLFTCNNVDELNLKGLKYLETIDEDISDTYSFGSVLTIDLTKNRKLKFTNYKTAYKLSIWLITEDSFTDNLDNDSFTYFKYSI